MASSKPLTPAEVGAAPKLPEAKNTLLRTVEDWEEFRDENRRRLFYHHKPTNSNTYVKPDCFKTKEELELDAVRAAAAAGEVDQAAADETLMRRAIEDQSVAGAGYFDRISESTKLPSHNKGYQMLLKMGWKKDGGLGVNGRGILEPIVVDAHFNALGLGKKVQDEEHNAVAAKERKRLEIEKIDLTPEERRKREELKEKIEVCSSRTAVASFCSLSVCCRRRQQKRLCPK